MKKPNVLIFFTDDQRFDTIGAMGNNEIKTPNLDKFAHESVAFRQGHIMGGTCGAVCMPSRAMLQTGRTVFTLHDEGRRNGGLIPPEHTTMPEMFKQNGYFTQHIGKWHQDKASFNRSYMDANSIFCFANNMKGRSSWYGHGGHYAPVLMDYDSTGKYELEHAFQMENGLKKKKEIDINIENNMHSTDIFCDTALNFIENYDQDKPFYLYLALVAPHDPRNAPAEYEEMYSPDTVSTPENFMPIHPFDNGELWNRDESLEYFPRREYSIRRHIADYYSMISHIDARFGDVMAKLKEKGLYDDTIIIFAGDNGLALGQHGLMGKQSVYEHSVRVPLMVKPAGEFAPRMTDAYAYLCDIFPTLCDLCGFETPESVNSESFADVVNGVTDIARRDLFFIYRNFQRAYKNDKFKLIEYFVTDERNTQLFDLENDPKEKNNLANNPAYKLILEELKEKLNESQVKFEDPLVTCSAEKLAEDIW